MLGINTWSYKPYKPLLEKVGDLYISRVVPYETGIHFEWIGNETQYNVFCRKRGDKEFLFIGETDKNEYDIKNLTENNDYEFYVKSGDKESRTRIARSGKVLGTVVNYLHPDDEAYEFAGRYIGSPSFIIHPDGYLLAAHDVFAPGHPMNLSFIFRSDDKGETWHHVCELMPCEWSQLFIHNGDIYVLGVSTEYGDLLIGKSTDGGKTFTAPVALLRGAGGKNKSNGVHKSSQNPYVYNGRIYFSLEWGTWDNKEFFHAVMVMSCDINDDLLVPENWHITEPLVYNNNWKGTSPDGIGSIEGTLVEDINGNLCNVMRYITEEKKAIVYKVDKDNHDSAVEYSYVIDFPCNLSKFQIKFDKVSGNYYSIANRRVGEGENETARNLLSLMVSKDLKHWDVKADLIDERGKDRNKVGYQYVAFEFVGDEIWFLSRTSENNANNFHDANYLTFHKVKGFRNI